MIWPGVIGIGVVGLIALFGPSLGRRLPPAVATRLLGAVGIAAALITTWTLALVAVAAVARVPEIAEWGQWSPNLIRASTEVPTWLAITCAALGTAGIAAAARVAIGELRAGRRMRAVIGATTGELVVVDDSRGRAFAVPGRRRHIVVTTGLLGALDPVQCRAVIAHETSHLDHGHAWWLVGTRAAAAVNPALTGLAATVAQAAERWADEDAARAVGDRQVVAHAVARAALHLNTTGRPQATLAATGGRVSDRVQALLEPPPRPRALPVLVLAALVVTALAAAVVQGDRTDEAFDRSGVACATQRCP